MKSLSAIAAAVRRVIYPRYKRAVRRYKNAGTGRLLFSAPTSSANNELYQSLSTLRDRSRALCRDSVHAKRAKKIVVDNVIGPGMGLQAQVKTARGRMLKRVNTAIEDAWKEWAKADHCHTGASMHFCDFERACFGEIFEAGEVFVRLHVRTMDGSDVPLALELIESERIADDHLISPPAGVRVTMGVEHDDQYRPLAYYVHEIHPNEAWFGVPNRLDNILRIPASEILHLKITDRWPQVRGVPWSAANIGRAHQLDEFELSAAVAARVGASKVGFFENPDWPDDIIADGTIEGGDPDEGTPALKVEPGQFTQLPPGYKFQGWDPAYPHQFFEPFERAAHRGLAAGWGVSYESLTKDYSQSNYSSSRLSLLDDRDGWRIDQAFWIRSFRERLHARWLDLAILANAIPGIDRAAYFQDQARFYAAKFKARGWGWVDPQKEVGAFKEGERAGYLTKSQIIAATSGGMDLEDYITERAAELDMLKAAGIETDTTTPEPAEPAEPQPDPAQDNSGDSVGDEDEARVIQMRKPHA